MTVVHKALQQVITVRSVGQRFLEQLKLYGRNRVNSREVYALVAADEERRKKRERRGTGARSEESVDDVRRRAAVGAPEDRADRQSKRLGRPGTNDQ